ncbi:MAG: hypothetical protein QF752_13550, partial [Planctomycetota bacterium]|nr:hypothetical protein [Planctomycetota bacterium]
MSILQSDDAVSQAVLALRRGVGSIGVETFSRIDVSGPDARSFLHAQTTSDVNSLGVGEGQASASLTPKAYMVAIYGICRAEDRYVLLGDACRRRELLE